MATDTTASQANETTWPALRPYRITVDVYHRLIASGVFGDKSSFFLWKGQLVEKVSEMTKGRPHVYAVNQLDRLLGALVPAGWFVEQDQPMEVGADSVPEPDLKVVRGAVADYLHKTPTAWDVPLVVEVADSSPADDAGEMLRAYAGSSIPCSWIVNIPGGRVEVYRRPEGGRYVEQDVYGPDDEVPVILDGREVGRIAVREVLP